MAEILELVPLLKDLYLIEQKLEVAGQVRDFLRQGVPSRAFRTEAGVRLLSDSDFHSVTEENAQKAEGSVKEFQKKYLSLNTAYLKAWERGELPEEISFLVKDKLITGYLHQRGVLFVEGKMPCPIDDLSGYIREVQRRMGEEINE